MEDLKAALEYILTPSRPIFLVGALIVLLVPILVHFFIVQKTPYTNLPSILLTGPPGGGKTTLLTLLEGGTKPTDSQISRASLAVELTVSTDGAIQSYRETAKQDAPGEHKKFLLVDTPGHGKLRGMAMGSVASKENLKGIVFMLDAAALVDNLPLVANYLYDVLLSLQKRVGATKTSRAPNAINVLIAANKTDLFTAQPPNLVKSNLETELARVRRSRSKGLLDSGVGMDDIDNEEQDNWLGSYGSEKFAFDQMREFDIEVEVVGGSVLEGKIDNWWNWISEHI